MITDQLFKLSKQIDVAINRLNNHIMLELVFEAGTRKLIDIGEQIPFIITDGKPYVRFDAANEIWNEINTFVSIDDINLEFEYNKALDKENEYTKLSNNLLRSRSETAYELIKYGLSRYEGEHPFSLNLLAKDENDIPLKYEENRVALDGYPNRYELQCATIRNNYPNFLSPINLATLLYTSTSQFLDTASATPQVEIPIIQFINFDIAFALAQLEKQIKVRRHSIVEVSSNRTLFDLDKFQLYLQDTKIENTFILKQIIKNATEIIRINNIDLLEFEGEENTIDPQKQYRNKGKDFYAVTQSKNALDDFYKENPKRFLSQDFAHNANNIIGIITSAYPELNDLHEQLNKGIVSNSINVETNNEMCNVPFIGNLLITNYSIINANILNKYFSLIQQPSKKEEISEHYDRLPNHHNDPYRVCIYGAYPLMRHWALVEYKMKNADDDESDSCTHWKRVAVYEAMKDYARGFQQGFENFLTDIIDNKNSLSSSEAIRLQKIKAFVENPLNQDGFSEKRGRGEENIFSNWVNDGIKGGHYYKAWYLIFENHLAFAPLFENDALTERRIAVNGNKVDAQAEVVHQLPTNIELTLSPAVTEQQIKNLRNKLIERNYIDEITESDFLYIFTGQPLTSKIKQIKPTTKLNNAVLDCLLRKHLLLKPLPIKTANKCFELTTPLTKNSGTGVLYQELDDILA